MSLNECRVDSVGQRNLGKILGEIILRSVGTESSWERGGCGQENGGGSWHSAIMWAVVVLLVGHQRKKE